MKIFLVCLSDFYYRNEIFNLTSSQNRDNAYYPFYLLKMMLSSKGLPLNTYDYLVSARDTDYCLLFFDIPSDIRKILAAHQQVKKYLVLFESEVVLPLNWDVSLHKHFTKIFTWNDSFVDGNKYIKINFSSQFHVNIHKDLSGKTKLCAMIAGNKRSNHPLELYSKRIEAIRWFEQHHPDEFDLYGIGWDEYAFPDLFPVRLLNKFKILKRKFAPHFPSYRGRIDRKIAVLEKYKFSICYDNVRDLPGYITEKIFDCFFAGCVPIYWGANNVTTHIPKDCFIDKRDFDSYESLYLFIKNMDDNTYLDYLNNIERYIKGPGSYEYTAEYFAETITNGILNG